MSSEICAKFDKEVETITEFLDRFFLQCSELLHKHRQSDAKQVQLLARTLPVEVFTDVQRAIAPENIADISYEDLTNTLTLCALTGRIRPVLPKFQF